MTDRVLKNKYQKNVPPLLYIKKESLSLHRFWKELPYKTGCSAVRLAHLLWEQGVVGSNPATPTKKKEVLFFLQVFRGVAQSG